MISEYIWSTTNPFLPSYYWHGRRLCRDMCPWRDDFGVLCPLLNILMYWRTQLAPGYMTYVMLGCWYWWKLTVWHWKLYQLLGQIFKCDVVDEKNLWWESWSLNIHGFNDSLKSWIVRNWAGILGSGQLIREGHSCATTKPDRNPRLVLLVGTHLLMWNMNCINLIGKTWMD